MIILNDTPIKVTMFPDKTSQVWQLSKDLLGLSNYTVEWKFEYEGEIMHLVQLVDLLRQYKKDTSIGLDISTLPYARQDKNISNESTFALHSFSKVINMLNFDWVLTVDAHSTVAKESIMNLTDMFPQSPIRSSIRNTSPDMIVLPDAGALLRYKDQILLPIVTANKVRNQLTGDLSLSIEGDFSNKKILIIDDLCDGGGTFILLAKELRDKGAADINLYVTHGIFSKGIAILKEAGIKKIFTQEGEV